MSLQAVLFDLGDTLVDLGEGRGSYEARLLARARRVYDVLAQAGVALPAPDAFCAALATDSEAQYHAALVEQQGISIFTVMRRFFERSGVPADAALVEAAAEAYCVGGMAVPSPLRLGALDVLRTLRGWGLRLGAISNTIQPVQYMGPALSQRGLAEYLDVQLCSADVGVAKPHPAIFHAALAALAVAAEHAVYVGDRLGPDVAGAQRVGMRGVLIEVAHRVEHDPQINPDARIKELPELLDVLPALFQK